MSDAVEWLYARDVAADLDVSRRYASTLIKRIPGSERMYKFDSGRGERWRISRAAYDAWRADQRHAC